MASENCMRRILPETVVGHNDPNPAENRKVRVRNRMVDYLGRTNPAAKGFGEIITLANFVSVEARVSIR